MELESVIPLQGSKVMCKTEGDTHMWSQIDTWFVNAGRSSRWMDLLGDYAGMELFVIDGEALLQIVLDDPLLFVGRNVFTFQILHAYHSMERLLAEYHQRQANFEIVFWGVTKHLSIQTERDDFAVASRALARSMVFNHLFKLPFNVHVFEDLDDPLWIQYASTKKPMFVMSNDGSVDAALGKSPITFLHRAFLLDIHSRGLSVALLKGAEYRDSKIFSFVYEPLSPTESKGVLADLRPAIQHMRASLEGIHVSIFADNDCLLNPVRGPTFNGEELFALLREIHIIDSINQEVPSEIAYLFIVHILLVPSLTIHQRAQARRQLSSSLEDALRHFLLPIFVKMAKVTSTRNQNLEIDGTIFITLISLALTHQEDIEAMIGATIQQKSREIWKSLGGPALDFNAFRVRYSDSKDGYSCSNFPQLKDCRSLLPFCNPVFDEVFSSFSLSSNETDSLGKPSESRVIWSDDQHWHNHESLLPQHLGGLKSQSRDPKEELRRSRWTQKLRGRLHEQAVTLTGAAGASLKQMVIISAVAPKSSGAERNGETKHLTKKAHTLNSTERLKKQIQDNKLAESKKHLEEKWTEHLTTMEKQSLSAKVQTITSLFRNAKLTSEPYILVEMQVYHMQLELQTWIEDNDKSSPTKRDKYTVLLMKTIQDICCCKKVITPFTKKAVTSVLIALGFSNLIHSLFSALHVLSRGKGFSFIKLVSSRTKTVFPAYSFMAITEHPIVWQLRLFGDYMDRSMDSAPDVRVGFEPDAWQRRVLDGIDQNKSLLVVAPTSAGKTFISFYAMEKILKESDDGILVYVAPTKSLVRQVAAEVYARFNKTLNGKSCWAIHTRDIRVNDLHNCQILVTVPEVLSILLLSPPMAKTWTPRIKRIVLDEIHSIGQFEAGPAWEQIILFAPCPIIGLSATIGSPKVFSDWLASVQQAHGFDYDFIEHRQRYSHLRKFFYTSDGKGTIESLHDHQPTNRMRFMHPITMILFDTQQIPSDLSLEAADTLSLYHALSSVEKDVPHDIRALDPEVFFHSSSRLMTQRDVLDYELRLKSVVVALLSSSDMRDPNSAMRRVIRSLQGPISSSSEEEIMQNNNTSISAIHHDIIVLLADLNTRDDLPAILFSLDRSNCEALAQSVCAKLKDAEEKWRNQSTEWAHKITKWQSWKLGAAGRKQAFAKAREPNEYDDIHHSSDPSGNGMFDPEKPSSQFSFVGRCTGYSMTQFEEEIKALEHALPAWAVEALRRGIAVHHAGMHVHYRSLIENLFRRGFIRVMISTGTLALGINAPAKTSVFVGDTLFLTALMYRQCAGRAGRRGFDLRGNVVFYGLPVDRVRRLALSKLPVLTGGFPLTVTTALRLFNLLSGSDNAEVATRAIKSMLSLPQIVANSNFRRDQLLHHLRFSIEYLRRSFLLDNMGNPVNLAAIVSHLYYTEPSNLALVALLNSRVLHRLCNQGDLQSAKRTFMLVMCNLFGRRYLSKGFSEGRTIKALTAKYPSMIVLPPLPEIVQQVLIDHDNEILQTFQGYALKLSKQLASVDDALPLSGVYIGDEHDSLDSDISPIRKYLQDTAIPIVARSPFVANSGHGDSFTSVVELTRTTREGLNLNHHAIPSMSDFYRELPMHSEGVEHQLNAYILDFYTHGQFSILEEANCIRRGDVWYMLHDFELTLTTVRSSLLQLMLKSHQETKSTDLAHAMQSYLCMLDDEGEDKVSSVTLERPHGASTEDWQFFLIVHQVCRDFKAKFQPMWA